MGESSTTSSSVKLEPGWLNVLAPEFEKPYFKQLKAFLLEEKARHVVFPPGNMIFRALDLTPFDQVKVVLIGQDPYHGPGQAHGLCFSVPDGVKQPPSLVNICKEISNDLKIPMPADKGNLESWARQGVLLLNATLTVRANSAGSHQGKGWEQFTDKIITEISAKHTGLVFLLWGRFAQNKEILIDTSKHHVLKAAHPSPFSAYNGFFGCGHFSKTNELLAAQGKEPINWAL